MARRGVARVVGAEAVEVHLSAAPDGRNPQRHTPLAAKRRSPQHSLARGPAERHDKHLVAPLAGHVQRVAPKIDLHLHTLVVQRHARLAEGHGRHSPVGHHEAPVVHPQRTVLHGETVLVEGHEKVALRHVEPLRTLPETLAQRLLESRRHPHSLGEPLPALHLRRGARVAHLLRAGPHAPFASPLIANDRAHAASEAAVDTFHLFCHDVICFSRVYEYFFLGGKRASGPSRPGPRL
ncbi:MAG: hypothetical protein IJ745_04415 [Bacteroidales bacterium]|nr:hypothetical protein [Bacteroidales bacterium]